MRPPATYESLLATDRAVKRRGNWVRVHTAGEEPDTYWLEFDSKATAKLAGASLLIHIREKRAAGKCNTDHMYNALIFNWLEQLRRGGYIQNLKESVDEDNAATDSV